MTQVACVLLTLWTCHFVPELYLWELVAAVNTHLQWDVPAQSNIRGREVDSAVPKVKK